MRKFKINAAADISPGGFDDIDEQFMQDVGSIITLEDGSSLDLRKARLLYNPESRKIQLSDTDSSPAGFVQLATLNVTSQEPEVIDDESFEEPTEETAEEPEGESTEEESADEGMGETAGAEDSGDFFQ